MEKDVDRDQTPPSVASDMGLHCLQRFIFETTGHTVIYNQLLQQDLLTLINEHVTLVPVVNDSFLQTGLLHLCEVT